MIWRTGFALDQTGIGPDDARKARLVAGSAIARLDPKTAVAFGFSEGAKEMERRLRDAEPNGFLIAKDIAGDPALPPSAMAASPCVASLARSA